MNTMVNPKTIRPLSDREYAVLYSICKSSSALTMEQIETHVEKLLKQRQPCPAALEFLWKMGWVSYARDDQGNELEGWYEVTPVGKQRFEIEQAQRKQKKTGSGKSSSANDLTTTDQTPTKST